jgi:hypothetical protein
MGEWEKVVKIPKPPRAVMQSTAVESKYSVKLEGDGEGEGEKDVVLEREDHRRFLQEKIIPVVASTFGSPSALGEIKLKRQRLTLREENEFKVAEEMKLKIKVEREEEREAASLARWRGRGGDDSSTGWGVIDVKDEEPIEFDPIELEETKVDVKVEVKVEEVIAVATVSSGGFKKRKMMGSAAASRKKP